MDTERWTSLNSIIDEALDLPPEERIPFIRDYEGLSDDIQHDAISFIKSIQESTHFWDRLIESNHELIHHFESGNAGNLLSEDSFLPDQIGPYKVLHKIASGGMGNVYLAERTDGHLQITVALKVIKKECIDDHHIRQFNIERNILGKLNHPHIAHIYDGGITETGQPYLVMEYVNGQPVTDYCSENQCSVAGKLDLVEQICEGVNFAHSNLVVHRDLKPDNIFVKPNRKCKILDFGIAKILSPQDGTDEAPGKSPELKPFSIRHAAPEQLSGGAITTSTDVYALGLLMYELLTGSLPFKLNGKTPGEALKIIKESRVPPASSRVSGKQLQRTLRGDLGAIIQKTLQKNPAERYQSAGDLLKDIRNYRMNRPVSISVNQPFYIFKKFVVRNSVPFSFFLIIFTILFGLSLFYINSINSERQKAIAQEEQASFIAGFMVDLFDASDPASNISDTLTVYEILQSGVEKVNNWEASDLSKADIMISLGNAYKNVGDFETSQSLLEDAFDIYQAEVSDPNSADLLNPVYQLAAFHNESRGFENSAHYFHQALTILNNTPNPPPGKITDIYSGYGNTISELGNPQLAIFYLEQALENTQDSELPDISLRRIQTNLAQAYRGNQEYEKSESLYNEILDSLPADDESTLELKSVIHNNLGYLMKVQQRLEEAIVHYTQSLETNRFVYGEAHPNTRIVLNNIAGLYKELGFTEEAEGILDELLQITLQTFGEFHWRTGVAYQAIGILNIQAGALTESTYYFNQAVSVYTEALGPDHIWTNRAILYHAMSRFNSPEQDLAREQFMGAYTLLKENRSNFSRYDVELLNNLIRDVEPYSSIASTSEFDLLQRIQ